MCLVKWLAGLALVAILFACGIDDPGGCESTKLRLLAPYVGQGHGIAIAQGRRAIVFDAGPPDQVGLREALERAGVDTIEAIFLTHPDLDHWGGLDSLLVRFPIRTLIHGPLAPEPLRASFGWACRRTLSGCSTTFAGRRHSYAEGLEIDVLWPDSGRLFQETNDGSLVMRAHRGSHGLLLVSGDLDTLGELQVALDVKPVDVLQLGHHGSKSSGHLRFLGAASPKVIVVQAGIDNDYGHPTAQALARAKTVGAAVSIPTPENDVVIALESEECGL